MLIYNRTNLVTRMKKYVSAISALWFLSAPKVIPTEDSYYFKK